jgi:tRNA isopentenyl-2-thiomethyl-A-37 hydroxylase MiaE
MTRSEDHRAAPITADDIPWGRLRDESSSFEPSDVIDLLVEALLEAQSHRLLAQQAIHAVHDEHRATYWLRRELADLKDEYRRARALIMLADGAQV